MEKRILSEMQAANLRRLMKKLGLRQNAVAKGADIAESFLSDILHRKKGVAPEKWRSLVAVIEKHIEENQDNLRQTDQLEGTRMLLTSFESASLSPSSNIRAPGGIFTGDPDNYIIRPEEKELFASLHVPVLAAVSLTGGVQYGKSNLLRRFVRAAEAEGYPVHFWDADHSMGDQDEKTEWDLRTVFGKLINGLDLDPSEHGDSNIYESAENTDPKEAAIDWFQKMEKSSKWKEKNRIFIIVDSLDSLVYRMKNPDELHEIFDWFTAIRSRMNDHHIFCKITLVVAYSGLAFARGHKSVFVTQSKELMLPAFTLKQIQRLLDVLCYQEDSESTSKKIFETFGGHPYLSHLATYEVARLGKEIEDVITKALLPDGEFKTHINRIKAQLYKQILTDIEYESLINGLINNFETENDGTFSDNKDISIILKEKGDTLWRLGVVGLSKERKYEFIKFYAECLPKIESHVAG